MRSTTVRAKDVGWSKPAFSKIVRRWRGQNLLSSTQTLIVTSSTFIPIATLGGYERFFPTISPHQYRMPDRQKLRVEAAQEASRGGCKSEGNKGAE